MYPDQKASLEIDKKEIANERCEVIVKSQSIMSSLYYQTLQRKCHYGNVLETEMPTMELLDDKRACYASTISFCRIVDRNHFCRLCSRDAKFSS